MARVYLVEVTSVLSGRLSTVNSNNAFQGISDRAQRVYIILYHSWLISRTIGTLKEVVLHHSDNYPDTRNQLR